MNTQKKHIPSMVIAYLFLIVLCIIWVIPLIFSFATSFRSQTEIVSTGFRLLPVAVTHTVLVVIVVSVTAYGYGRMRFKYRDRIFYLLMGISMFPGVVNLIPSYKIIETFGWVNSSLAMIIPGLAGMGNIFLVRQFMKGIPLEFDESARMDGADEFTIFAEIIVPLIKPVLIVAGLFSFMGSWNDFLWPVIVYTDVSKMPITAGLLLLQDIYGNYRMIGQLMGSALIAIIPTVMLFLFAQKYFIESMNLNAGIKG